MADFIFLIIVVFIFFGFGFGFWFLMKREISSLKKLPEQDSGLALINQNLEAIRKHFEDKLSDTQKEIQQSFERQSESYARMQKELGTLQEIGGQMRGIQEFLQSPKLRGNLGEQVLRDLLEQILPKNHFNLQFKFKQGEVVDAVLKTNQGIIPVDAKFPMENFRKMVKCEAEEKIAVEKDFRRDIKKHVDDVAGKYILPEEGTVDFAIIYVPSEAVYYEVIVNQQELLEYGYQKKVYLASPNTFYYFLKIIMVGLEGAKIESAAKKILAAFKTIQRGAIQLGEELRVLTSHVQNVKTAADRVNTKYDRLTGKIETAGELEGPKDENSDS